ncbi:MBL fold metallo-hydrolase [Amycolatopsis keratiniphila]|uniref:Beta-lactamase class B n=1 Tax=Amycolatopsis keratiniphila TaxID=129921 RepID=R4THQ0_9PSEU|nr:MBL fold metallo-hydrolase [Amycolatopsis keratiniphila]AGM09793.1 beta-lactamase class B [Amycolatopsis keratiniphila]
MRVHHLNCGTMRPVGGKLIDGKPGLFRRAELICHCLLLETDSGLVLVETGVGTPTVTRPVEWLGAGFVRLVHPDSDDDLSAPTQIRKLGFDPADVRDIVLTHLDLDHAGGLVDFPHARVHVHDRELQALEKPIDRKEASRYRKVQFDHGPIWRSYRADGEPWFGFDAVRELDGVPDVLIIPLAGHTRGHAGVAVDTGDGWLLNAGDAVFHGGELERKPHIPLALGFFESYMQTEKTARLDNQRRLRELVSNNGAEVTVFAAHDATAFERLSQRSRL